MCALLSIVCTSAYVSAILCVYVCLLECLSVCHRLHVCLSVTDYIFADGEPLYPVPNDEFECAVETLKYESEILSSVFMIR